MKSCAILGAGGHGKVVAELAELNGFDDIVFFDDRWPVLQQVAHWPVLGNSDDLIAKTSKFTCMMVAIGNNAVRLAKQQELVSAGASFATLVHPQATVSLHAQVGFGSVVMANATINPCAIVGQSCIVNTGAVVEHDCRLSDGVHLSPNCALGGGSILGQCAWLGIGAVTKQLVSIGAATTVGAGAAVVNDLPSNVVAVGTPAQIVEPRT